MWIHLMIILIPGPRLELRDLLSLHFHLLPSHFHLLPPHPVPLTIMVTDRTLQGLDLTVPTFDLPQIELITVLRVRSRFI